MMKIRIVGVLALALPFLVIASAQNKPTEQQLTQEFHKLQQDFSKAQEAYFAPYQNAKTQEEADKIKLDPAKNPAKTFLPKFQAFAKKVNGNMKLGPQAEAMVIQVAQGENSAAIKVAIDHLLNLYIKSPTLDQNLYTIGLGYNAISNYDRSKSTPLKIKAYQLIESKSPHKNVRAAALFRQGEMLSSVYETDKPDPVAAKKVFDRLIAQYPDSTYAKQAQGAMFEIANLQIGKVAPDFEATDENGVKWKLSDYRGKVVVLDFWGFW